MADPNLGTLTFGQVVDTLSNYIDRLPEKPFLIGHSMGGLAVQKLIAGEKDYIIPSSLNK
jgi:pimeloyl-ACP methyl ester carboxylesterase